MRISWELSGIDDPEKCGYLTSKLDIYCMVIMIRFYSHVLLLIVYNLLSTMYCTDICLAMLHISIVLLYCWETMTRLVIILCVLYWLRRSLVVGLFLIYTAIYIIVKRSSVCRFVLNLPRCLCCYLFLFGFYRSSLISQFAYNVIHMLFYCWQVSYLSHSMWEQW